MSTELHGWEGFVAGGPEANISLPPFPRSWMLFPNWEPLNARICHAKLVLSSKMRPRSQYLNNPATWMPGRLTCISTNVIYCITSTPCEKLYIGNTGGKLADCFREHLRHVEKNYKDVSKQVARHYDLQKNDIFHFLLLSSDIHQNIHKVNKEVKLTEVNWKGDSAYTKTETINVK